MAEPMKVAPSSSAPGSRRFLQAAQRSLAAPSLHAPYREVSGTTAHARRSPGTGSEGVHDDDRCEGCERARRRHDGRAAGGTPGGRRGTPASPREDKRPAAHCSTEDTGAQVSSIERYEKTGGKGSGRQDLNSGDRPSSTATSNAEMNPPPAFPALRPPHPESWQRAVAYRINNTSLSRSSGRKVIRNRKHKPSVSTEEHSPSPVSQRSRPGSLFSRTGSPPVNPEDDEKVLVDEDHDLELMTSPGVTEEQLYACACRRLGVVPVAGLARHLTTDELPLRNRKLGPKGARACATVLVNNLDVNKLDLEGNDLGSQGTAYIAQMLKENFTITELNLKENFLESEGLRILCDVLKERGRIKVLDLSGNNLHDKDAKFIGDMLEENRTIRELYLAHNAFSEAAGEYLAPSIAVNDALEMLDLSWNHLRRQGAVAMVLGLKENSSISTLNLAWNGFHVEGCQALTDVLATASTLTYLDLSCNRINCLALKFLLDGLKKNCTISVLKVGYNPITTEGAVTILKAIDERGPDLPLRELDLSDICVDSSFIKLLKAIRRKRLLAVRHGMIMKNDDLGLRPTSDPFSVDDPMTVLMEFMRIRNLRLIDLFSCLDKDGNKSLSREEFRDGLMSVNIPLSTHALNELIDKLDTDGDGEVDFSELLEGQKQHKKKISRILARSDITKVGALDSDLGRVNAKIRALMAMTSIAARAKHRGQSVTSDPGDVSGDVQALGSQAGSSELQAATSRVMERRRSAGDSSSISSLVYTTTNKV